MATATKNIIINGVQADKRLTEDEFKFSVAYLPMNTPDDFKASFIALALAPALAMLLVRNGHLFSTEILASSSEKEEVKVMWMLR